MTTLTTRLSSLSTAEEFLAFFAIPFDQRVVDVYRLHILKRFGATLTALEPVETKEDPVTVRAALTTAYRAFATDAHREQMQCSLGCARGCGGSR